MRNRESIQIGNRSYSVFRRGVKRGSDIAISLGCELVEEGIIEFSWALAIVKKVPDGSFPEKILWGAAECLFGKSWNPDSCLSFFKSGSYPAGASFESIFPRQRKKKSLFSFLSLKIKELKNQLFSEFFPNSSNPLESSIPEIILQGISSEALDAARVSSRITNYLAFSFFSPISPQALFPGSGISKGFFLAFSESGKKAFPLPPGIPEQNRKAILSLWR